MGSQPPIADLHYETAPDLVTEVPGPESRRLVEKQKEVDSSAVAYPHSVPIGIDAAKGATLRDVDGNTFIDFFAGIGVLNVGHTNPYVLEGVEAQLEKVAHTIDFPTEARIDLIEKLDEIAPGDLRGDNRVLFGGPTGSDAIEATIKLAKYNTGGSGMIAFRGSYHGASAGALSLTAGVQFKTDYAPLLADVQHVPFPHPTHSPEVALDVDGDAMCPIDGADCCGKIECARSLANVDELLSDPYAGLPDPAGVWVEPVQATGGLVYPPPGFLRGLKELTEAHDIPLIVDEIQTGFGRTGEWFASDRYDVTPDIMPMSKSISGIGLPLAATMYREDYDTWGPGGHVGTYRGNAPAMVGGLRAIEYIRDQDLLAHARRLGGDIGSRLEDLAADHDRITDVRGEGLFWGIEFADAADGTGAADTDHPEASDVVNAVQTACYESGLLIWKAGRFGEVVRIMPPLVVTEDLLETGLDILTDSVDEVLG